MSMPQYPAYSGGPTAPAAPPRAPGTVTGAFAIYLLEAIILVVGIVVGLNSSVWDEAARAASNSQVTLNISTLKTIVVVIGVLSAALFLFFAFMMRAGRNWARIVLTVLSALSLLSSFSSRSSVTVNGQTYSSSSSQATGWIGAALSIVAIILMYLAASNQYFAASKAARKFN